MKNMTAENKQLHQQLKQGNIDGEQQREQIATLTIQVPIWCFPFLHLGMKRASPPWLGHVKVYVLTGTHTDCFSGKLGMFGYKSEVLVLIALCCKFICFSILIVYCDNLN